MKCPRRPYPPIDEDYSPFWMRVFIHSSTIEFAGHIETCMVVKSQLPCTLAIITPV